MGLRGPAKTPSALALVRGNPGKRTLNRREPKPSGQLGAPPSDLGRIGKALWRKLVPQLRAMRLESQCDREALEIGCSAYEEWREARAIVVAQGITYERRTASGELCIVPRPEVTVAADAQRRFLRFLQEFGLTPSARTRVKADGPAAQDPLEEYLKAGKKRRG